jgi:capsular polysaccharide export protein
VRRHPHLNRRTSLGRYGNARLGKIVISSDAPSALMEQGNLLCVDDSAGRGGLGGASSVTALPLPNDTGRRPFLRIPPFPGAKLQRFRELHAPGNICDILDALKRERVGGTYWAAQPRLPEDYILVSSCEALDVAREIAGAGQIVLWSADGAIPKDAAGVTVITGACDPWHMLSNASAVIVDPRDELRSIAAVLEVRAYIYDARVGRLTAEDSTPGRIVPDALLPGAFENPFSGEPMTALEAIALCGFWRRLIDSNRGIGGGLGFAFWKQSHVAPLLWDGTGEFQFLRSAKNAETGKQVAIWRAKASPEAIADLERNGVSLIEVEDGFLRSSGLGADCIPPLSITVDRLCAHFDPARASELELLLQNGHFDARDLERAREVRRLIIAAGLGKYGQGRSSMERPAGDRRHILVPGQVEDDRAVTAGGCGLTSNLELLKRVRARAPDSYILYKPHPDVLAGHRRGAVSDRSCLEYADQIAGDVSIASLIEMVDEIHVNTSLAGFEALLRGKSVVTHGAPFYAGWGLTRDLGPVPSRRSARRTMDEVVAATLLLYPRYLDPETGLPCPVEVVVARLSASEKPGGSLVVGMRRLQGKLMRGLRSLVQ